MGPLAVDHNRTLTFRAKPRRNGWRRQNSAREIASTGALNLPESQETLKHPERALLVLRLNCALAHANSILERLRTPGRLTGGSAGIASYFLIRALSRMTHRRGVGRCFHFACVGDAPTPAHLHRSLEIARIFHALFYYPPHVMLSILSLREEVGRDFPLSKTTFTARGSLRLAVYTPSCA